MPFFAFFDWGSDDENAARTFANYDEILRIFKPIVKGKAGAFFLDKP